ncbi:hypothetical protein V1J52_21260 [Streptomyces sp. TRM 70351]|uniref:hypothetical protein n=1 Tax=Streptomyces sp. TRM 70351 TaxID=3116552 RepID=UPI002E7C01A8|nr:hypothetical protein [Streptomyces sp. TRM 70351]MEE1930688.1 hypothetical protein [Streptomyces sp. TRM 70351]
MRSVPADIPGTAPGAVPGWRLVVTAVPASSKTSTACGLPPAPRRHFPTVRSSCRRRPRRWTITSLRALLTGDAASHAVRVLAEPNRARLLPITISNTDREALEDRQAATIRHNAARGVRSIEGLSETVLQLVQGRKNFDWFEKNLGM